MADDEKPDLNYDDWDSLPLAPDDDDWDAIPPPTPRRLKGRTRKSGADEDSLPVHISLAKGGQAPGRAEDASPPEGGNKAPAEAEPSAEAAPAADEGERPLVTVNLFDSVLPSGPILNSEPAGPLPSGGRPAPAEPVVGASVGTKAEPVVGAPVGTKAEPVVGASVGTKAEPVVGAPVGTKAEPVVGASVGTKAEPVVGVPVGTKAEPAVETSAVADPAPPLADISVVDSTAAAEDAVADEPPPSFDAHLTEAQAEAEAAEAEEKGPGGRPPAGPESAPDSPEADSIAADLEDISNQKVELDIEGIFLDDGQKETSEEDEAEAAPEPEETPAPQPEEPSEENLLKLAEAAAALEKPRGLKGLLFTLKALPGSLKQIPKTKLLIIAVPALLIVLGLGFGLYKLVFSGGGDEEKTVAELIIDPAVPPREPEPGIIDLDPFYISFPAGAGAGETVVEMSLSLHYNDLPDRLALEDRLPAVRDLIYRAAQAKGEQLASSGEVQRVLREELLPLLNALAGSDDGLDYVQLVQIRILR